MKSRGIACSVKFLYVKGHRNPYKSTYVPGERMFTFIPTAGIRFEFDMSVILFGIAYARGLFVETLDELLDDFDDALHLIPLEVKSYIAGQAVFVAATQADTLDPNTAMRYNALNPKLQKMCVLVGLTQYNSFYSFRRTAATETRTHDTTEKARELLSHAPEGNAIYVYDHRGFADCDLTAYRLREKNAMSNDEVSEMFRQANTQRYIPPESSPNKTLESEVKRLVDSRLREDPEYIEIETTLMNIYTDLAAALKDAGVPGFDTALGYSAYMCDRYRNALTDNLDKPDMIELSRRLDDQLALRKTKRKTLRVRLAKEALDEIQKRQEKNLRSGAKAVRGTHGAHTLPAQMRQDPYGETSRQVLQATKAATQPALNALASFGNDDDGDVGDALDEDLLDEQAQDTHEEPLAWRGLSDNVSLEVNRDGCEKAHDDMTGTEQAAQYLARIRVIKKWIAKVSRALIRFLESANDIHRPIPS
jgi:hypothetical protein